MYNILHALDHLYINLYHVCTNAEMDKYRSFTKQFSQNNSRGKKTRSSNRMHILMIRVQKEDNGDSGYKTDASNMLAITDN